MACVVLNQPIDELVVSRKPSNSNRCLGATPHERQRIGDHTPFGQEYGPLKRLQGSTVKYSSPKLYVFSETRFDSKQSHGCPIQSFDKPEPLLESSPFRASPYSEVGRKEPSLIEFHCCLCDREQSGWRRFSQPKMITVPVGTKDQT
jgi:hypothetical protein